LVKTAVKKNLYPKPLRYHLRFQVIPGKNAERDARILAGFCKNHCVEEVVIFFAGEEWNNGLLSLKEENMWFNTVKKVKHILEKTGIKTSLNPWMTVLHCDRGRKFPEDRKFKPAVSPCGETSKACGSFADDNWRDYIYKLYGRFARLGFRVTWVEDDFRYHNHSPLTWGIGFEKEILKRFERKIGRGVSREEVVRNILKPGPPHPWREKWMENWREIQIEVAEGLASAVSKNAPDKTKIGLMSSHPTSHSVEGRDWQKLFRAFTIGGDVAHRPHFGGYSESLGRNKVYSIMMLDVQKNFRPASCEVAPEIENFPYTNWNKSDTLTWAEMALCMFFGSDALLLNLFPFSGNPADREPGVGKLLDRSRPGLEWISSKFSKDLHTRGVGIPWKQDAATHVHTYSGQSMHELNTTSFEPGYFLLPCGVPVSANFQKVNALFGSLAWAFTDNEILQMLGGGLLLDAVSAEILCERGFSKYIGVEFKKWTYREESKYSVEMIVSRQTGIEKGFYMSVNLFDRTGVLKPIKKAREWTVIITPEKKYWGPGMIAYKNEIGGRIITHAVPNPARLVLSYQRQILTQKAIERISKGAFDSVVVIGGPHLIPIHFENKNQNFAVILNGSPDASSPAIKINSENFRHSVKATLLAPLAKPEKVNLSIQTKRGALTITSCREIPYLGFLVLEW